MRRLAVLAAAVALISAAPVLACGKGKCKGCCDYGCGYGGCGYGYGGCGYGGCGYGGGYAYGGCGNGGCGFGGCGYAYAGSGQAYYASAVDTTMATLVVTLPEDAKLTIDDEPTASTSDTRIFSTRGLTPGQDYVYTLKAKVTRDGETLSVTKKVT